MIDTLDRYKAGDPDALQELMQKYNSTLEFALARRLNDPSLIDECVQLTWINAYKHAHKFNSQNFNAWIHCMRIWVMEVLQSL